MVQKLSRSELFSLILVIILNFVSIACANMLIPSYGIVIQYFHVSKNVIGLPDATFVLVSAGLAVLWGYYTDRIDRSKVVMIGAFLWSIGTTITAIDMRQDPLGFGILVLSRGLTGAGMGCVIPVGYSVLGDLIPAEERSGYFGTMAILSSVSNGAGQGMSSFLGPLNIFGLGWHFPFALISVLSIVIICLLFFVKIPQRGSHEEELQSLQNLDLDYLYQLSKKDITQILKKKTNIVMFVQGFLCIIPGTLVVYFLTTSFSDSSIGLFRVLPIDIRLQVSAIMAGLVGVGYLVGNSILAQLGDVLYKKNKRNRVVLGAISLFVAVPACIMFVVVSVPLKSSFLTVLGPNPGIFHTIIQIFKYYPSYIAYVIFAFIGSFFSAAPIANRGAILVDVNLPEHRGTSTSFFNLAEQVGKGLTLALSFVLLTIFGSYQFMIIFAVLFWLPAGIIWIYGTKHVVKDMDEKSIVLRERTQLTFIDYIFELEIKIDDGIQLVHDAKHNLHEDYKVSMNQFNKAIKLFQAIEAAAKRRDMSDVENKAHNLGLKAIMLKTELQDIIRRDKDQEGDMTEQLNQLKYEIDNWWEPSDLGKIEILYDSGNLKVLEAKLQRKFDLFETIHKLKESIDIFERVYVLARERLVDEGAKKLTKEEQDFQDRVKLLIERTNKAKENTLYLKERLEQIIEHMKGVSMEDFKKTIELAAEYKVPYTEVLIDSIEDKKQKRFFEKNAEEIDQLFKIYEQKSK